MRAPIILTLLATTSLGFSSSVPKALAASPVVMTERAVAAGIVFEHDSRGKTNADGAEIQNLYGPGVAWADLNHDRYPDLIVANGAEGNRVYLNDRDGTFTEVSISMGIAPSKVANGICLADADNDGMLEMVFANFYEEPHVYRGLSGSFSESAEQWGVSPLFPSPSGNDPVPPESMGVAFGDYDSDGFVDLYIANYLQQRDLLYKNNGGGLFTRTSKVDVTDQGFGFGGVFWDFDNDGDQDIYVVNDFGANFLFENQGAGLNWEFFDMAPVYKVAGGGSPMEAKSMGMGIAIGDYDNDQDLDLYITNYILNALYENQGLTPTGVWRFRERAKEAGVEYPRNCWGVDFADFDLDGDLDLIQASGYIVATMEPMVQPMELPNKLWLNDGGPAWTFTDVSAEAGFDDTQLGRGLATADYDRDGDMDVVVTNNTYYDPTPDTPGRTKYPGELLFYRNDQQTGNNWLIAELEGGGVHAPGSGCNRSAVGARVTLTAGGTTQMREVRAGESYLSQNSLEVEFGLGQISTITQLKVRWLCGHEEVFTGASVNNHYILREGASVVAKVATALLGFDAYSWNSGVRLEWLTSPDADIVDIDVYRSTTADLSDEQLINVDLSITGSQAVAFDTNVLPGREYVYRIVLHSSDGTSVASAPVQVNAFEGTTALRRAELGQNYPNPFNPNTVIEFMLPKDGEVRLKIFDARGRHVRTLSSGLHLAGPGRVEWDGTDDLGRSVASGVYHYALETDEGAQTRSMVLVK